MNWRITKKLIKILDSKELFFMNLYCKSKLKLVSTNLRSPLCLEDSRKLVLLFVSSILNIEGLNYKALKLRGGYQIQKVAAILEYFESNLTPPLRLGGPRTTRLPAKSSKSNHFSWEGQ